MIEMNIDETICNEASKHDRLNQSQWHTYQQTKWRWQLHKHWSIEQNKNTKQVCFKKRSNQHGAMKWHVWGEPERGTCIFLGD